MPKITDQLSAALSDRYRIERHLGEGGMANVYLATDLKHERKVRRSVFSTTYCRMWMATEPNPTRFGDVE